MKNLAWPNPISRLEMPESFKPKRKDWKQDDGESRELWELDWKQRDEWFTFRSGFLAKLELGLDEFKERPE